MSPSIPVGIPEGAKAPVPRAGLQPNGVDPRLGVVAVGPERIEVEVVVEVAQSHAALVAGAAVRGVQDVLAR